MMKRLSKKLFNRWALPRPTDGDNNHNDSKTQHLSCPRCHRLLIVPTVEKFCCQCGMIFSLIPRAAGSGDYMQLSFSFSNQEENDQGSGLPRELVERMPLITTSTEALERQYGQYQHHTQCGEIKLSDSLRRRGHFRHCKVADEWEKAKKPAISGEELKEELVDTDKMVCRICLSDYKAGDSVRVLPCFHRFHVDEIDDWLNQNSRCPLCHLDVYEALTGSTGVAFVSTVEGNPIAVEGNPITLIERR